MAIEAAKEIEAGGKVARVVSMVCWELFEDQDESYKNSILPPDVTARVSTVVPHALHILLLMKLTALGDPWVLVLRGGHTEVPPTEVPVTKFLEVSCSLYREIAGLNI